MAITHHLAKRMQSLTPARSVVHLLLELRLRPTVGSFILLVRHRVSSLCTSLLYMTASYSTACALLLPPRPTLHTPRYTLPGPREADIVPSNLYNTIYTTKSYQDPQKPLDLHIPQLLYHTNNYTPSHIRSSRNHTSYSTLHTINS